MKIEIKLDESCAETKIIVVTDKITDEVSELMRLLAEEAPRFVIGFYGDAAEALKQADIIRVYAANGKVYAVTGKGEYQLRLRLYEIEKKLNKSNFVRISNSEIVNLDKVKRFDLSLVGTICVSLSDGSVTYASRRYVTKIKQTLGI